MNHVNFIMFQYLFGFLILFNFALALITNLDIVSEAIFDQNETFQYTEKSTSSDTFDNDDDENEYFSRTFEPVARFTMDVFTLVGQFYDEFLNTTLTIKDEEIVRLEEKIKQLEENEEQFEEKQTSAELLSETEALENITDVYDEHEFMQFFYNKKMNKVIHLVNRNIELVKKMQNIRNDITAERYMSSLKEMKKEAYDIMRSLILKAIEKDVPEVDFERHARTVIDTINNLLENSRDRYNKEMAEKNEKIRLLKQRIEESQGNEAVESVENTVKDEL